MGNNWILNERALVFNRNWATREEIAAIHDARADKLEAEVKADPWALEAETKAKMERVAVIRKNAADLRHPIYGSRPVGARL